MKKKLILITLITLGLVTAAFAGGSVESGKKLFMDAKAFKGQKPCSECHPNGRGLEKSGAKMKFNIMGKTQNGLEEAVNFCIVNANKGKAIDVKSKEMMDMVAYIKSLGMKSAPAAPAAPGYGAPPKAPSAPKAPGY